MADISQNPGLDGVIAAAKQAPGRGLPPVHLWNPTHCGEIDIVIKRDGRWFHEGSPIGREALVRLFSTVLRKDSDGFHLVTPVEKMRITVEDAPFIATRVDREGQALRFLTNVGDEVEAGPENPIRVEVGADGQPRPYVHVRRGLNRIARDDVHEGGDAELRRSGLGEPLFGEAGHEFVAGLGGEIGVLEQLLLEGEVLLALAPVLVEGARIGVDPGDAGEAAAEDVGSPRRAAGAGRGL